MGKESQTKNLSSTLDRATRAPIAKICAVSDQKNIASVGAYLRIQRGLTVGLKPCLEKAIDTGP